LIWLAWRQHRQAALCAACGVLLVMTQRCCLLHHSTTVNIRGESYRLKDKKRAGIFMVPPAMATGSEAQLGNLKPGGWPHAGLEWPAQCSAPDVLVR
jgi:hypothetical protein